MKKPLLFTLSVVLVLLIGGGFLVANYYSVLADVREQFVDTDTADQYAYGATLFQTRGCVFCHTLAAAAASGQVGPALDGIGNRADAAYIRTSIVAPNAVLAMGCPEGACEPNIMPPFGDVLDDAQIEALVIYLKAQP